MYVCMYVCMYVMYVCMYIRFIFKHMERRKYKDGKPIDVIISQ